KKPDLIPTVVNRCRDQLGADVWTWGDIGRVFNQLGWDARAADWMSDWSRRDGADSWMPINLTFSLRGLGRHEEARPIHEHALAKSKPDYTIAYHEAWLALDDAVAGNSEAVQNYFARSNPGALDSYHSLVAA